MCARDFSSSQIWQGIKCLLDNYANVVRGIGNVGKLRPGKSKTDRRTVCGGEQMLSKFKKSNQKLQQSLENSLACVLFALGDTSIIKYQLPA